jgi:hypothetical protein
LFASLFVLAALVKFDHLLAIHAPTVPVLRCCIAVAELAASSRFLIGGQLG